MNNNFCLKVNFNQSNNPARPDQFLSSVSGSLPEWEEGGKFLNVVGGPGVGLPERTAALNAVWDTALGMYESAGEGLHLFSKRNPQNQGGYFGWVLRDRVSWYQDCATLKVAKRVLTLQKPIEMVGETFQEAAPTMWLLVLLNGGDEGKLLNAPYAKIDGERASYRPGLLKHRYIEALFQNTKVTAGVQFKVYQETVNRRLHDKAVAMQQLHALGFEEAVKQTAINKGEFKTNARMEYEIEGATKNAPELLVPKAGTTVLLAGKPTEIDKVPDGRYKVYVNGMLRHFVFTINGNKTPLILEATKGAIELENL